MLLCLVVLAFMGFRLGLGPPAAARGSTYSFNFETRRRADGTIDPTELEYADLITEILNIFTGILRERVDPDRRVGARHPSRREWTGSSSWSRASPKQSNIGQR